MKLRKKLAALLAAAMIASVMPMTAFAASDNSVSNVVRVAKETKLVSNPTQAGEATAPVLKIEMKHDLTSDQAFFIELTGAEWDDAIKKLPSDPVGEVKITDENGSSTGIPTNFEVEKTGSKFLTIRVGSGLASTIPAKSVIHVPLLTQLKGGEATVKIIGDSTAVTSQEFIFANSSEGIESTVVVDDPGNFSETGTVATISITEPYAGAYASEYPTGDIEFELELRDSDFKFEVKEDKPASPALPNPEKHTKVEGRRGFNFRNNVITSSPSYVTVTDDVVKVKIPASEVQNRAQAGEIVLSNVGIKATRKAAKGEVRATLRGLGKDIMGGSQSVVIANHTDFTTKLEMKKEYEVQTGKEVEVEFTLSEEIADSLLKNRAVAFELSGGAKFQGEFDIDANGDTIPSTRAGLKNLTVTEKDADKITAKVDYSVSASEKHNVIEVSGFNPRAGKKAQYTFKTTILVPNNFVGEEVKLTAEGRALSDTHEIVAATVKKAVEVDVTPMDVKVGLKQQVGGKIVIKENAKESILRNYKDVHGNDGNMSTANPATIDIRIGDEYGFEADDLRITDADIEVTEGDLVLDLDAKIFANGVISIPVKRQSTEPSTIEITNITIDANRMVPEGKYAVKVGGNALSKNTLLPEFLKDNSFKADFTAGGTEFFDTIAVEDFINITTKNTEDFTGVTSAEVKFVVGSNQYLVNGEAKDMDAGAYVKDGRTMVPVRYVASALGITEDKIVWEGGAAQTATILADKVIQVKLGSKTMVVNGANVPMTAAAEIKDGRTFVPVAEIARALNVSVNWDEATKTATFNAAK